MSQAKSPFNKPPKTYDEQVAILRGRGLVIANVRHAAAALAHLNYYRFSGYCLAFESSRHVFLPGTTFEQVEALYKFDHVLRDLIAEAIEVVEIDFRTTVAHHFAQKHGAFGHTLADHFFANSKHHEWLEKVHQATERSSELFIGHFRSRYQEYPDLPIWMAVEVMSFGECSRMYSWMERDDQIAVARRYNLHHKLLKSWVHHLVYVRNLCAHHSRLFGRIYTVKPELPGKESGWQPPLLMGNNRLHCTLLVLNAMLTIVAVTRPFAADWRMRLTAHLIEPLDVPTPYVHMGLTSTWASHPLWK